MSPVVIPYAGLAMKRGSAPASAFRAAVRLVRVIFFSVLPTACTNGKTSLDPGVAADWVPSSVPMVLAVSASLYGACRLLMSVASIP